MLISKVTGNRENIFLPPGSILSYAVEKMTDKRH